MQAFRSAAWPGVVTFLLLSLAGPRAHAQTSFPTGGDSEASSDEDENDAESAAPARPAPAPKLTPRLRPRPPAPSPPSPSSPVAPSRAPSTSPAAPSPAAPAPTPSAAAPRTGQPAPVDSSFGEGFRPPLLPSYRKMEPPPGYVERSKWNAALLVGGGLVLAVTYGTSLAYGSAQNFENGLGALAVPVFGPWMALGQRDFTCDVETTLNVDDIEDSQDEAQACIANQTATAGSLVGLGVGQLVGTALLTVGILDHEKQWVRMDLAGVSARLDVVTTPSFAGLAARGRF